MKSRADSFRETRKIHRQYESAEDYTELVADLIKSQGKARVCDIAREMGVSHVTVLKTIKKLIRDGYLIKNSELSLTEKGKVMATFSKKKHLVLSTFLLKLGVPEHIVATDVEGIEHHISNATLDAIEAHLKMIADL